MNRASKNAIFVKSSGDLAPLFFERKPIGQEHHDHKEVAKQHATQK